MSGTKYPERNARFRYRKIPEAKELEVSPILHYLEVPKGVKMIPTNISTLCFLLKAFRVTFRSNIYQNKETRQNNRNVTTSPTLMHYNF